ncbi:hypothetical protein N7495_000315 [Penicillium taxi]|uniref:uncharacterized protein n=1 Tax=Penicillium taxi TaxID=168475 RepID=UPI00254575A2|nr:uncharacterized protein N7495_000315 [Penicillium taxi]KAJ5907633.1 hypothetical protein N7495_000315 [Penicillium taxi]
MTSFPISFSRVAAPSNKTMDSADPASQDPLLSLRRAIASGNLPTPTTSSEHSDQDATDDLAKATHLYFSQPVSQSLLLTTPTRFISSTTDSPVDLRSIFFAWQKKDVAIPEYIVSAQELSEALKQKEQQEPGKEETVQNLVFVERLDLITWLEGASDDSEYIKPLEGVAAAADAAATAVGATQADPSTATGAGAAGISSAPSGAPGSAPVGSQVGRAQKQIDPQLQAIYAAEWKVGDRNTLLRGTRPTDFSFVRKSTESFLGSRSRSGQSGAKPSSKSSAMVPAPSAGLSMPSSRKSNSRPDPIILLSPSASSLIRMSNIKSFLQDGVFVPPDHPTLSTSTEANFMELRRPMRASNPNGGPLASASAGRGNKPTKFILVDGTTNFKPEYWSRLVAVFTTGQAWQFKSYKWSNPPDLFKHATGVYVGWRDEEPPSSVKGWGHGVRSFAVERWDDKSGLNGTGRWRDREIVEGIWMAIEEGMQARGWGSKG